MKSNGIFSSDGTQFSRQIARNNNQNDCIGLATPNRRIVPQNAAMRGMSSSIYDKSIGLLDAVSSNDLLRVMDIVKNGSVLQVDKDGKSPVHIAAENGYYDILKYLLQAFPMYNVNSPDHTGNTPLHRAASIGNVDMIKSLLERGAQVNVQDITHGHTPLHEAAWKGFADSVDLLCQVGRLPNLVDYGLFTPLHLAVQSGHNQTTRNLIKCGADITAKNKFGDTPLHTAVRYGHAGVSRIIISVTTNVNYQNQNGDTALHIAAALKRRKIVKLLLEAGAFFDIRNFQNESPIDVAVKKNHKEILEILSIARSNNSNPKTVSFIPDSSRELLPTQSRHVSIPNEMSQVLNQTPIKTSRAQSQSPHEKVKTKRASIVKGIFSRKKKDKIDKSTVKEEEIKPNLPMTPSKSILISSRQKKNDQWTPNTGAHTPSSSRATPVPGLINTYQPQRGNLFFKDLAGNIKQGPIGFAPVSSPPKTCNCTQYSQNGVRNQYDVSQHSNVCLDHGYVDYHGPMNLYQGDKSNVKTKDKGRERRDQTVYPLTRAKSDESLNQSESKARMQEERLRSAKVSQMRSSPVKGRRQSAINSAWNTRQNSLLRDFTRDQNPTRISIQISQKARELKEAGNSNPRSMEPLHAMMRPSPEGQTDSLNTPNNDPAKFKVDWRAGKYRSDKVMLPSSKV